MQIQDKATLVLVALLGVLFAITLAAIVIQRAGEQADIETRKIRFAAATFTGLLMLFIFTAVLYFADEKDSNRGKEIFEKAFTAMSPLAISSVPGRASPREHQAVVAHNPSTPSLKRSANGRPPGTVWLYAVHFRQPGPRVLPSSPAQLKR